MEQKHLLDAIEKMGREPMNPIGECFESSAFQLAFGEEPPPDLKLCHGIGVANMPGQEGLTIGHAWLEWGNTAYDTTWGVSTRAEHYRKLLKISYVVEYTRDEAMQLWRQHDYPGPWDAKIKAVTDDKKKTGKTSLNHAGMAQRNNDAPEAKASSDEATDDNNCEESKWK